MVGDDVGEALDGRLDSGGHSHNNAHSSHPGTRAVPHGLHAGGSATTIGRSDGTGPTECGKMQGGKEKMERIPRNLHGPKGSSE